MRKDYRPYPWFTGVEAIDQPIETIVKSTSHYVSDKDKSDAEKKLIALGERVVPTIVLAIITECQSSRDLDPSIIEAIFSGRELSPDVFDPFPGYTSDTITPLIRILGEIGSPMALPLLRALYKIFLKKGYRIGLKQKSNIFDNFFYNTWYALGKCDKPRRWWEKLLNLRRWAN